MSSKLKGWFCCEYPCVILCLQGFAVQVSKASEFRFECLQRAELVSFTIAGGAPFTGYYLHTEHSQLFAVGPQDISGLCRQQELIWANTGLTCQVVGSTVSYPLSKEKYVVLSCWLPDSQSRRPHSPFAQSYRVNAGCCEETRAPSDGGGAICTQACCGHKVQPLYPRAEVGHICPIMALQPLLMSVILCREETAYTS